MQGVGVAPAERLRAAEERAYALLEECRLRVAHLLSSPYASHALAEIHRRVGLAGYHTSTWMQSGARRQCLGRAHEQVEVDAARAPVADAMAWLDGLAVRADRAIEAIEEALAVSPSPDHLQLAQRHALAARQTMRGPVLARRVGDAARHPA